MLRPSTSRGLPALGCADSLQLGDRRHPLDRVEHRRRADRAVDADDRRAAPLELGREPLGRRAVERVAVLLGRHLRDDRQIRHAAHGVDRRADLVQIAERLEDEQIDAAVERAPAPARGSTRAPRRRRSCPTARCGCRAGRSRRRRRPARRAACRAMRAPCALIACSWSARPNDPSLIRLAPNVLVSTMSAPARTYSWCTSATRSGCVRFSASKLLLMKTPLA